MGMQWLGGRKGMHLSRGGKELLGSSDIGLDGGLTLLPANGADLTVLSKGGKEENRYQFSQLLFN